VGSIVSVQYVHPTTGVLTAVTPSTYTLEQADAGDTLRLAYGASWPSARDQPGRVQVRYTAGFATCPAEICAWILLRVGTLYRYREADADKVPMPAAFVDRLIDRWQAY
jgi:hypothetical protein